MLSVEDRYYKMNRIFLKILGLWPYQNSKLSRILSILLTILYMSGISVQLAVFITHECTLNIILNVLSLTFPSGFMLFNYHMYYLNVDMIKQIIEHIYYDWKSFKNKTELDIMGDFAGTAKLFTEISSFFLSICVLVAAMSHIVPMTLDIISPLNESRAQHIHIMAEYFLDQSVYYLVPIVHLMIFLTFGMIAVAGTGLTILGYGLHACALFKVANYRMEITIDTNVLQVPSPEREHVIYERIVCAVDIHRKAIQFCELLMQTFEKWFFFMMIFGVISLSINLFRLLTALIAFEQIVEMFIPCALVGAHFYYIFYANHVGQEITNYNAEIFNTVYNLPWYMVPLNIQKLLLFLLQKGSKNFYLKCGGIFDASYEGFSTLTTSSISYFTVIYSVQ